MSKVIITKRGTALASPSIIDDGVAKVEFYPFPDRTVIRVWEKRSGEEATLISEYILEI